MLAGAVNARFTLVPFKERTGGIGCEGESAATIVKLDEAGPLPKIFLATILKVYEVPAVMEVLMAILEVEVAV